MLTYCLKLFDTDGWHDVIEEFNNGLCYQEIIGTLLQARDLLEEC